MLVVWRLWRVIWISLLIDILEENLLHSIETIFGDNIFMFMDDKVPCHIACTIECHLYHNEIHERVEDSVVSPVPLILAA